MCLCLCLFVCAWLTAVSNQALMSLPFPSWQQEWQDHLLFKKKKWNKIESSAHTAECLVENVRTRSNELWSSRSVYFSHSCALLWQLLDLLGFFCSFCLLGFPFLQTYSSMKFLKWTQADLPPCCTCCSLYLLNGKWCKIPPPHCFCWPLQIFFSVLLDVNLMWYN